MLQIPILLLPIVAFNNDRNSGKRIELRNPTIIRSLDLRTSIYNIETRIGKNGKTYIMEVSPRGGGNRLAEMLRLQPGWI